MVGLYFMYYLTPMGEFSACLYDLLVYFIHVQTSLSLILFVSTKIQIGKFLILRVFYCLRFCFMYVLARVGRQLNGLHGEWTGSDDLDRFLELQHLLDSTSRVNRDSLDIIPHEPNMPRACLSFGMHHDSVAFHVEHEFNTPDEPSASQCYFSAMLRSALFQLTGNAADSFRIVSYRRAETHPIPHSAAWLNGIVEAQFLENIAMFNLDILVKAEVNVAVASGTLGYRSVDHITLLMEASVLDLFGGSLFLHVIGSAYGFVIRYPTERFLRNLVTYRYLGDRVPFNHRSVSWDSYLRMWHLGSGSTQIYDIAAIGGMNQFRFSPIVNDAMVSDYNRFDHNDWFRTDGPLITPHISTQPYQLTHLGRVTTYQFIIDALETLRLRSQRQLGQSSTELTNEFFAGYERYQNNPPYELSHLNLVQPHDLRVVIDEDTQHQASVLLGPGLGVNTPSDFNSDDDGDNEQRDEDILDVYEAVDYLVGNALVSPSMPLPSDIPTDPAGLLVAPVYETIYDAEVPENYLDPITNDVMQSPMMTTAGFVLDLQTYNKLTRDRRGVPLNPYNRQPIAIERALPSLRNEISAWVRLHFVRRQLNGTHGEATNSDDVSTWVVPTDNSAGARRTKTGSISEVFGEAIEIFGYPDVKTMFARAKDNLIIELTPLAMAPSLDFVRLNFEGVLGDSYYLTFVTNLGIFKTTSRSAPISAYLTQEFWSMLYAEFPLGALLALPQRQVQDIAQALLEPADDIQDLYLELLAPPVSAILPIREPSVIKTLRHIVIALVHAILYLLAILYLILCWLRERLLPSRVYMPRYNLPHLIEIERRLFPVLKQPEYQNQQKVVDVPTIANSFTCYRHSNYRWYQLKPGDPFKRVYCGTYYNLGTHRFHTVIRDATDMEYLLITYQFNWDVVNFPEPYKNFPVAHGHRLPLQTVGASLALVKTSSSVSCSETATAILRNSVKIRDDRDLDALVNAYHFLVNSAPRSCGAMLTHNFFTLASLTVCLLVLLALGILIFLIYYFWVCPHVHFRPCLSLFATSTARRVGLQMYVSARTAVSEDTYLKLQELYKTLSLLVTAVWQIMCLAISQLMNLATSLSQHQRPTNTTALA